MVEGCKDAVVAAVLGEELSLEPSSRRCLIRNPGNSYFFPSAAGRFLLTSLPSKKADPPQEWLVRERNGVISTSCGSGASKAVGNISRCATQSIDGAALRFVVLLKGTLTVPRPSSARPCSRAARVQHLRIMKQFGAIFTLKS
jgi:hypothetical protein